MLHGEAGVQICTFVIGSALVAPKFGTACGALVVADALGDVRGEPEGFADAVGVVCTPPVIGPPPRLARTITPTAPRRMTITTATAAGTSQGGRSEGTPRDGGQGTDCVRAGAAIGARGTGAGVGTAAGDSTLGGPVPSGPDREGSPSVCPRAP